MAVPRTRTVPTGFGNPPSSKRARRLKTANAKLEYHDDTEWEIPQGVGAMRKYVYGEVVRRMVESNSVVTNMTIEALGWMLPNGNAELWECLLLLPMILSDTELQTMMKLELSTPTTPNPPPGASVYYIRSYEITPSEFRALIDQLEEAGIRSGANKIESWKQAMELAPSDCNIFIRYVGMSQKVSAYARFASDLQYRNYGFYGTFMDALGKVAPHVITDCKVFTVPHAATSAIRLHDGRLMPLVVEETDGRERALIELLGRTTLINQRSGGKFNSYQPSEQDSALFQRLQTGVFEKFDRMKECGQLHAPGTKTQAHVTGYALEVMELGRKYPSELGTDQIKPNDLMEIAWAKQSTYASCYDGDVLFLLVGDYLPVRAMFNPAPYWEQTDGRSVLYMKDTLSRLSALEKRKETWDHSDINAHVKSSLFPMVDFQSTPLLKARTQESSVILRKYMAITRPIIVLSFERRTSAVLGTNFLAFWEGKQLTPIVGTPRIRYYTDPGKISFAGTTRVVGENTPHPNDSYIQIPCIHPGSLGYDEIHSLNRVVDMTLWQVILGLDVVLDILHRGFDGTRAELCEETLAGMNKRSHDSGVSKALADAKKELQEHYAAKPGRWTNDPTRQARPQLDGTPVNVTKSGMINMYWKKPGSEKSISAVITSGRKTDCIPSSQDAADPESVRTVHFLETGIDIRKFNGESCTFTKSSHSYTKPTFPGQIIYDKVYTAKQAKSEHLIEIWEAETGLVFSDTFPQDGNLQSMGYNKPVETAKHHVPPSRKNATVSKVKSSTAASAASSAATKATKSSAAKKRPAAETPDQEVSEEETSPMPAKSAAGPSKSAKSASNVSTQAQPDLSQWLPVPATNPTSIRTYSGGPRSISNIRNKCTACRLNGRSCDFGRPCGTCIRSGNAYECNYN